MIEKNLQRNAFSMTKWGFESACQRLSIVQSGEHWRDVDCEVEWRVEWKVGKNLSPAVTSSWRDHEQSGGPGSVDSARVSNSVEHIHRIIMTVPDADIQAQ